MVKIIYFELVFYEMGMESAASQYVWEILNDSGSRLQENLIAP